jgi:hypothetical protein
MFNQIVFAIVSLLFAGSSFAANPGIAKPQVSAFQSQAAAQITGAKASCDKLKKDMAAFEAKDRIKGRRVLKKVSDVDKALALLDAKEVSNPQRNELREAFFNNLEPTRIDIGTFLQLENSNCFLAVFDGLTRSIETAGSSTDAVLKEKTAASVKRWFLSNEQSENLLKVAMSRSMFDRAIATGVFKSKPTDEAFLQEIGKTVREKSAEYQKRFSSQADGLAKSNIDDKPLAEDKPLNAEDFQFDPKKMQQNLRDERDEARKLNARLKSWLAEH